MIWFQTGLDSSNAEFNALKSNCIKVYPLSPSQYINNEWVEKTAQIYQNGKWIDFVKEIYLYNKGDTCDSITGGWGYNAYYYEDYIGVGCNGATDIRGACTMNKIEKGSAKTLYINAKTYGSSGGSFTLVLTYSFASAASGHVFAHINMESAGIHEIDLSNVDQPFYVYFYIYGFADAEVDKVWMV